MPLLDYLYFGFSGLLWSFLTIMVVLIWRNDFVNWLAQHEQARFYLLGVEKLPDQAKALLRKFYTYLFAGWTWILLWAWWIMPQLKDYFFRSVNNEVTLKVARISTLIVIISYAAVGFFAIAKAITLWYRKIYRPTLPKNMDSTPRGISDPKGRE